MLYINIYIYIYIYTAYIYTYIYIFIYIYIIIINRKSNNKYPNNVYFDCFIIILFPQFPLIYIYDFAVIGILGFNVKLCFTLAKLQKTRKKILGRRMCRKGIFQNFKYVKKYRTSTKLLLSVTFLSWYLGTTGCRKIE